MKRLPYIRQINEESYKDYLNSLPETMHYVNWNEKFTHEIFDEIGKVDIENVIKNGLRVDGMLLFSSYIAKMFLLFYVDPRLYNLEISDNKTVLKLMGKNDKLLETITGKNAKDLFSKIQDRIIKGFKSEEHLNYFDRAFK